MALIVSMTKRAFKGLFRALPFKMQLFSLMKHVWIPPQRIYQHLYFHGAFSVEVITGGFFKMDHFGQQIENELFWNGLSGGWENTSIGIWQQLCKQAKVVFDVGANSGLYSLVAKTIAPQSEVYAFEPVHRVHKRLIRNNVLNNFNIQAEELALSNYDGEGTVYDTSHIHILSVTVNKNLHAPNVASHPVTISVKRMASYIKENMIERIDLIKLDVETHEPEVLEGMGEFLGKFRPVLLIEVLSDEIGSRIQQLVKPFDYWYFDIDEGKGAARVNEIKKSSHYNYLLCSEETAVTLGIA